MEQSVRQKLEQYAYEIVFIVAEQKVGKSRAAVSVSASTKIQYRNTALFHDLLLDYMPYVEGSKELAEVMRLLIKVIDQVDPMAGLVAIPTIQGHLFIRPFPVEHYVAPEPLPSAWPSGDIGQ